MKIKYADMPEIQPNRVYNFLETQHILGITAWGLRPAIKEGKLKVRIFGNKYRFLGQTLINYIGNLE